MGNKVKFGLENVHIAFIGINQAKSIEVTGIPGTDGEVELSVTADNLLGADSPASVIVPLETETHDTLAKVASAIVNTLNNNEIISGIFRAYHEGVTVYLETKVAQSNDSTLDITFTDTGTTGATMGTAQDVADGTTGWGTPQPIEGAVSLSTSPEGEKTEFYADNSKYYVHTTNNGYSGDLEVANIPDEIIAEVLGMTIDSDGLLIESAKDKPKQFALMGQIRGDKYNRRFCYYRCEASRPGQDSSTSESSVSPSTDTLSIDMLPVEDDSEIIKVVQPYSESNPAPYNTFFDSVSLPTV